MKYNEIFFNYFISPKAACIKVPTKIAFKINSKQFSPFSFYLDLSKKIEISKQKNEKNTMWKKLMILDKVASCGVLNDQVIPSKHELTLNKKNMLFEEEAKGVKMEIITIN